MAKQEITERVRQLPEMQRVYQAGYRILHEEERPSAPSTTWRFSACVPDGRSGGDLITNWTKDQFWLFLDNVVVFSGHEQKGIASALILAAALTSGCRFITASSSATEGKRAVANVMPALESRGVQFLDGPPAKAGQT